jgi:hypothetical protein
MSRRLTIYVPDDVADRVEREENASAFFTEAARRVMRTEAFLDARRQTGRPPIPQTMLDKARGELEEDLLRRQDPEYMAELRAHNKRVLAQFGTATRQPTA